MIIYDLKTNHLSNPIGFQLAPLRLSYKVKSPAGTKQQQARIRIYNTQEDDDLIYDSGLRGDINSLCFVPDVVISPRTLYSWDVLVISDEGEEGLSSRAYFETGKLKEPWLGRWITAEKPLANSRFKKNFFLNKMVSSTRLYICGLGLYEAEINGTKVGDEFLTPGCNDYNQWLQYQTYDVTKLIEGENKLSVILGDGWYKGPFGFQGQSNIYGNIQCLLCELHIRYEDGSSQVVTSDDTWQAEESPIRFSSIYDGEIFDATLAPSAAVKTKYMDEVGYDRLTERLSPPVRIMEKMKPIEIIHTPCGETVLDMGQIITGYLSFYTKEPKGHTYRLQYGEVLQKGCFYNENLRTAKQAYTYTTDGSKAWIRPHFTFYGFRYVKLEGFDNLALEDFEGCVLYSDMPQTAFLDTSSEKVNRLAQNALWGQKGNFVDVPTDCPQRDERMGWTGDAQAFCATACYQMDSAAFFTKYMHDMAMEQKSHSGGVPHVIPSFKMTGSPSCAWADAAAIIPWTLYLFYGDQALLEKQYENMSSWVEWLLRLDQQTGNQRLWQSGFHFADWLALDADHPSSTIGGTDPYFISSAYYLYSTQLTAKAAGVLNKKADQQKYEELATEILAAMRREYITSTGRLAVHTQTAYILALFLGIVTKEEAPQVRAALERKFETARGELRTGFVGTSYLCRVLTENGLAVLAYSLFLREDYPSWLYEVNMGATTVWERWNSILPDGSISDTGMNSLNHYTYGAIMEWVYRDVAAITPLEEAPGFRKVRMAPHMDPRLPQVDFAFESPIGLYKSTWQLTKNVFEWTVEVPFGGEAELILPPCTVTGDVSMNEKNGLMVASILPGIYSLRCAFEKKPWAKLPMDIPLNDLLKDEIMAEIIYASAPDINKMLALNNKRDITLRALRGDPFSLLPPDQLNKLEEAFNLLAFS